MTCDLRRLRLKALIYRPRGTHRYFVTPYGWKVARLFSRLEAGVFRPAMAMFTANDASSCRTRAAAVVPTRSVLPAYCPAHRRAVPDRSGTD